MGNFTKALSDTTFKNTTAATFVGIHMPIWFYTRCTVLPYMISVVWTLRPPVLQPIVIPFFCYLLGCMFVLHVYWFFLFIKIVLKFAKSGEADDLQNKTIVKNQK